MDVIVNITYIRCKSYARPAKELDSLRTKFLTTFSKKVKSIILIMGRSRGSNGEDMDV